MKILRNPNFIVALLFIYTTGMYIWLFPRNNEMGNAEKWTIVGISYALLCFLWWVLRRRERLRREREEDMRNRHQKGAL